MSSIAKDFLNHRYVRPGKTGAAAKPYPDAARKEARAEAERIRVSALSKDVLTALHHKGDLSLVQLGKHLHCSRDGLQPIVQKLLKEEQISTTTKGSIRLYSI